MKNWPAGLIDLLNASANGVAPLAQILWAELYTVELSTPNYIKVFDQFKLGAISSFWSANEGTFTVAPGKAAASAATSGGDSRTTMHWNRNAFLNDQFAQAMVVSVPSGGAIGVCVRAASSANTYYAFYGTATTLYLFKVVAGTVTVFSTYSYSLAVRDILRLEVTGTLLQGKLNGNVVLNATDAAITSGAPGITAVLTTTAGSVTNWVGGSIGQRYFYTNYSQDVSLNGQTFTSAGQYPNGTPLIQRSRCSFTKGTEVGEMEISFADNGSVLINGVPLLTALAQKQFDGATIDLSLAASCGINMPWQGPGSYFFGRVSDVTPGRTLCKITVKDKREEMNQKIPRRIFQQGCAWTLFDSGCTLNAAAFAVNGTVQAGSNKSTLQTDLTQSGPIAAPATACSLSQTGGHAIPAQTYYVRATYITAQGETSGGPESHYTSTTNNRLAVGSPPSATGALSWNCYVSTASGGEQLQNTAPIAIGTSFTMPDYQQSPSVGLPVPQVNQTGYFDLGYIIWTSGANIGMLSAIRNYLTGGVINFYVPLLNAPATSDTFTAYPGCDKQQATCTYKFSNTQNYAGMPFTPPPETTI